MNNVDKQIAISVIIPVYNERDSLNELTQSLKDTLDAYGRNYELIFVDDGSKDGSFELLRDLMKTLRGIRIVKFQMNYGKSAALSTGFESARGEYIVTIDSDLQDDPNEIPCLLDKLAEGFDLVSGWKKHRKDPVSKRLPSKIFNLVTSIATGIRLHDHNCGLKVYRRNVVKKISIYGELHRYIPAMAHALGFRVTEMIVQHHQRKHGKSKYGIWRYFAGFFDLLTVMFLTRFTTRPLHLFGSMGLMLFIVGIIINLYLTTLKYFYGEGIGDRPLLFLGILLILVGFQVFSLGLLAEMITKLRSKDDSTVIKENYD